MNAELIHNIIFYVMYASMVLLCIVFVERAIYFAYTLKQGRVINDALEKMPHCQPTSRQIIQCIKW